MEIYDFDNSLIENRASSLKSKDGVFSSFFDILKIYRLCSNHGLQFAQIITLIPGIKIVRIHGYKKKSLPANSVVSRSKGKERAEGSRSIKSGYSRKASKRDDGQKPQEKGAAVQHKRRIVEERLDEKQNSSVLSANEEAHNAGLYYEVKKVKAARDEINKKLSRIKQDLQNARMDLRKANTTGTSAEEDQISGV
ncbi:unnamed protein product [Mucor hiemalis]